MKKKVLKLLDEMEDILTTRDLIILGIFSSNSNAYVNRGKKNAIPFFKRGHEIFYSKEVIEDYLLDEYENDDKDICECNSDSVAATKALSDNIPIEKQNFTGVLTAVKHAHAKSISIDEMQNALKLMKYYINEALRIQGASNTDRDLDLAQSVSDWLASTNFSTFSTRDVYQNGPRAVRNSKTARKILEILAKHKHISDMKKGQWKLNRSLERPQKS